MIQLVENENMKIKEAAEKLQINYSTAKHIIKVYRTSGKIETSLMKKRKERFQKIIGQ